MEITVINNTDNQKPVKYRKIMADIADKLAKRFDLDPALSATVVFVDDQEIRELNRQYRKIDQATDVLSFALKDESDDYEISEEIDAYLGDIFISVDAITRQAASYGHDFKREALFLFTHGLLHLLGYDHDTKKREETMFALQDEVLDEINN